MKLIYLYHSGFALLAEDFTVIIDYFQDSQSLTEGIVHDSLLNRPGKLYVLSSHFHADHFNRRVMNWRERKADIVYILSKDICRKRGIAKPAACWLKKGETYQDENLRVKAYGSTDAGISFELQLCGKTIFHAGDLNNWHWMDESDEAEWRGYENHFLKELENICSSMPAADLALFPVDPRLGSEYMRGAIQFTEKIQTRAFLPMHFDEAYEAAHRFQSLARDKGILSPDIQYRGQVFDDLI